MNDLIKPFYYRLKVKPPFPALSSFNVSAQVLAYFAFSDKAETLLRLLSRNTQRYLSSHSEILESFLTKWPPVL